MPNDIQHDIVCSNRAPERSSVRASLALAFAALTIAACRHGNTQFPPVTGASPTSAPTQSADVPAFLLGDFEDDYGAKFTINRELFFQRSRNRFHIVQWNVRDQYFIAQNDSLNPSDAGKWTRVDWMPLTGMPPFDWAFCFSAWNAATRPMAESAVIAKRDAPRTGCNGFPFTRMKKISSAPK